MIIQYEMLNEEQLEQLVADMQQYAKEHPFDSKLLADKALESGTGALIPCFWQEIATG